jgi:UDP-sugar diphosphatase
MPTKQQPTNDNLPAGFTFELCAGLVDKGGKSLAQITAEEVEEECGYRVAAEKLRSVGSAISSSGTTGAEHYIFFGTVGGRFTAGSRGCLVYLQ